MCYYMNRLRGIEMFKSLKKDTYFKKLSALLKYYYSEGKITLFDEEIFKKMESTYICALPVALQIKYARYFFPEGSCYERSLYMFLALDDAILVRGDIKSLEYLYGKDDAGHGWIELGNFVYDSTVMLKFDKNIYYALYKCSNVEKINKEDYLKARRDFVKQSVSYDIKDFLPNGEKRMQLASIIEQLKNNTELMNDEHFIIDLENYLALTNYDEQEIKEEQSQFLSRKSNLDKLM